MDPGTVGLGSVGQDSMDLRNHVVVVAGATGRVGSRLCRLVLAGGGKVAAAVRKPWQVAIEWNGVFAATALAITVVLLAALVR